MRRVFIPLLALLVLTGPAQAVGQDDDTLLFPLGLPDHLTALTPSWLSLSAEQRTRYETFNHSFRRDAPGSSQQVHLRTRLRLSIKDILDPLRLTIEVADFRAPLADQGQGSSPLFVNTFDFFQLHADLHSRDVFGTGLTSELQVGRLVMDFGRGRLVAGFRYGSFTPTFDGLQWTVSRPGGWLFRGFATQPVQQHPHRLDRSSPVSRFWGLDVLAQSHPDLHTELYVFGLDEGRNLRQRELVTPGLRLFNEPAPGSLDYEVESIYQVGRAAGLDTVAHRHHGEVGYSFDTPWQPRVVYLFDYASGDKDPGRNFDFLFAKRRTEYGPTGTLGIIFPSNVLSPAGFRLTVTPRESLALMLLNRAFWLADSRGPFVGSGLQDPTGRSGGYLGDLLDTAIRWTPSGPFWRRWSVDLGYTHFFKGGYFDRVPGSPGGTDVDYVYSMVALRL